VPLRGARLDIGRPAASSPSAVTVRTFGTACTTAASAVIAATSTATGSAPIATARGTAPASNTAGAQRTVDAWFIVQIPAAAAGPAAVLRAASATASATGIRTIFAGTTCGVAPFTASASAVRIAGLASTTTSAGYKYAVVEVTTALPNVRSATAAIAKVRVP
jgi:hypothetical protein